MMLPPIVDHDPCDEDPEPVESPWLALLKQVPISPTTPSFTDWFLSGLPRDDA